MKKILSFIFGILIICSISAYTNCLEKPQKIQMDDLPYIESMKIVDTKNDIACIISPKKSINPKEVGEIRASVLNNYYKKQDKTVEFVGGDSKLPENGKIVAYIFKINNGVPYEYIGIAVDNKSIFDVCKDAKIKYYNEKNNLINSNKYSITKTSGEELVSTGETNYYAYCGIIKNEWVVSKIFNNYRVGNKMRICPKNNYIITRGKVIHDWSYTDFRDTSIYGSNPNTCQGPEQLSISFPLSITLTANINNGIYIDSDSYGYWDEGNLWNILFASSSSSTSKNEFIFESKAFAYGEPDKEYPVLMKIDSDFSFFKGNYVHIRPTTYVLAFKSYN